MTQTSKDDPSLDYEFRCPDCGGTMFSSSYRPGDASPAGTVYCTSGPKCEWEGTREQAFTVKRTAPLFARPCPSKPPILSCEQIGAIDGPEARAFTDLPHYYFDAPRGDVASDGEWTICGDVDPSTAELLIAFVRNGHRQVRLRLDRVTARDFGMRLVSMADAVDSAMRYGVVVFGSGYPMLVPFGGN